LGEILTADYRRSASGGPGPPEAVIFFSKTPVFSLNTTLGVVSKGSFSEIHSQTLRRINFVEAHRMGRRARERRERIRAGIEIPISLKARGVHVKLSPTERTVTEAVARNRRWERRHPEKTREDTRRRVQRYRERQKALGV
jgi:hypothetical protein